jgi:hypothetical protein
MRQQLGDRLHLPRKKSPPGFSRFSRLELLFGSPLAAAPKKNRRLEDTGRYFRSILVAPNWEQNTMGWNVVPDGLKKCYCGYPTADNPRFTLEMPRLMGLIWQRPLRETDGHAHEGHLRACAPAMETGVHLVCCLGSLLGNFEWQFSYANGSVCTMWTLIRWRELPKLSSSGMPIRFRDNGCNITGT